MKSQNIYQIMRSGNYYSSSQSETMRLWNQQKTLQQNGLDNEIDRAEIKAAMKGFRNSWSKAMREHPKLFNDAKGEKKYNWEEIKHLKENFPIAEIKFQYQNRGNK